MYGLPERLRVLHIVETLDVGGMERMVATLCRALDSTAFEVRVLVTKRRGVIGDSFAADGGSIECAGVRADAADYLASRHIVPHIRRFRPHVVHTHATHALLYGGGAALWCGVRALVHTEHGRIFPDKPQLMLAERWLSRRLVRYVAVSDELAEAVHRHQRIPVEKISVIANGVRDLPPSEQSRVHQLRAALVSSRPGPVVGVVARLVWEKGLDVLLRAWARRRTPLPARGTLVIAGEGPERQRLEQLSRELGIQDTVVLPGTVTDIASLYRMLDVFVMSSVSEGLPMALLEAMAAGLPIIATSVGGIPSALARGEVGVLVPPKDVDALASAIDELLEGGEQLPSGEVSSSRDRHSLAKSARERFESSFTASAMAASYAELYRYPYSSLR